MAKPEKILASELLEREVVDMQAGEAVGAVVDFAVTRDGCVALIGVLPLEWFRVGQGIAPSTVTNVTRERVCIEDSSALAEFDPYADEEASALTFDQLQGKTVVEQEGSLLGVLVDFAFMLSDGRICELVVLGSEEEKRVKVAVEAIRAVGRDYIVIERGQVSVAAPLDVPAPLKPAQPAVPAAASAAHAEVSVPAGGDPLPPDIIEHAAARIADEPQPATESGEALFNAPAEPGKLTKFDQKKADFLRGKKAHRDIAAPDGDKIVAKGAVIDDKIIAALAQHQLLGEVFVEMTVSR